VTFEGLIGDVTGVRLSDGGLHTPPSSAPWYFLKVPVYLPAGAAGATIKLENATAGSLAWVPVGVWTSGVGVDLTRWMASEVVFAGCPHVPGTCLGGLLSANTHLSRAYRASAVYGQAAWQADNRRFVAVLTAFVSFFGSPA
jgi:hypothetical protein